MTPFPVDEIITAGDANADSGRASPGAKSDGRHLQLP